MTTILAPDEPQVDAAGDVFDPELHATKPDGTPSMKTDGTFRKRRRDAGGARSASAPKAKGPSGAEGMPKAIKEQHARHVRGIRDGAGVGLAVLSFVSPVDAYCLGELVDPFADALATVAQEEPRLAAALDKVGGLGGWGAVASIAVVGVVQVMHNHGKLPETVVRMVGGKPRRDVERILQQRGEAMAAQAAGFTADDRQAAAA